MIMRLPLIPNHFRRRGVRTGGYSQAKNAAWMHFSLLFFLKTNSKITRDLHRTPLKRYYSTILLAIVGSGVW